MNNTSPHPEEDLAPLDAFEQQWVDQLTPPEPDLVQTQDAFVQAVMQQVKADSSAGRPSAVLARIGKAVLPYAIAAALLLAAFVGWVALTTNTPNDPPIAQQNDNPSQPGNAPAVATHDQPKLQLGKLIANAKATATSPANNLTAAVNQMPDTLNIDRAFDLLGDAIPDLKEILAPLEPKNEQSRA